MSQPLAGTPDTRFQLPDNLSAPAPPETRGLARDQVRLLVAEPGRVRHARFTELDRFLEPGDLLVVNNSATLPAAADGVRESTGVPVVVHVSTTMDDHHRIVELRTAPDAADPVLDATPGERIRLGNATELTLIAPVSGQSGRNRLWRARTGHNLTAYLQQHGRPIRYRYVPDPWPLEAYQTVFATEPGSAEMPSAGRPFTPDLVHRLVARGVGITPLTLHTGVSSQEAGEKPVTEWFRLPPATAELVNRTRRQGNRVIAVGTTVVRALESAADHTGNVRGAEGWTDLVIDRTRPPRVVDSLISGLHAPDASHLLMLEALAGPALVRRAYQEALRERYLWHEFGDLTLLLPDRSRR